jgi:hypothetical protein
MYYYNPLGNDPEAVSVARDITSALRSINEEDFFESPAYQPWGDNAVVERPETSKRAGKAQVVFNELAAKLASDVDVVDVAGDVAAYEELQRIATISQIGLPILRIGSRDIPCLLTRQVTRRILGKDENYLDNVDAKMVQAAKHYLGSSSVYVESREKVSDLFFTGLESYLAARIGGKRWLDSNRQMKGSEGGGFLRFFRKPASQDGQWWDVINKTPGLVLYWANEYGVRVPAMNIGGKTKPPDPFRVFLRTGSGYIGGDAKPNHEIEWEESVVRVPSMTPVFATNRF